MSWNICCEKNKRRRRTSASSWGCELKFSISSRSSSSVRQPLREAVSWNDYKYRQGEVLSVSLFVRLWVEILSSLQINGSIPSASSWGCELKFIKIHIPFHTLIRQPLREAVSWNIAILLFRSWLVVSLFVRLWVEIQNMLFRYSWQLASASSWGCELKYHYGILLFQYHRQPLREAVSWNIAATVCFCVAFRQPLREAVSWNTIRACNGRLRSCQPLREAVSWNVKTVGDYYADSGQPLREAVSWNSNRMTQTLNHFCQPLREAVSWNNTR